MLSYDHNCPRCASSKIYKSRFRHVEHLLPLALLRPVRCGKCDIRYYRPILYSARQRWRETPSIVRRDTFTWVAVRAEQPSNSATHSLGNSVEFPEQKRTA